jgi:hypothetical protein
MHNQTPQKKHVKISDQKLRKLVEQWDHDQGRAMKSAKKSKLIYQASKRRTTGCQATARNAGLLCRYWSLARLQAKTKSVTRYASINHQVELTEGKQTGNKLEADKERSEGFKNRGNC